ncbi:MAG: hypothetical protein U0350_16380 [Caldilineaceae bacterium]
MTASPRLFAEELHSALWKIKATSKHKNLTGIKVDLGEALNRNGESYIGHLLRGNAPTALVDLEVLVQELVRLRGLDAQSCAQLLRYGGHPKADEMAQKLFPNGGGQVTSTLDALDEQIFIAGPPLTRPHQFFGREREVRRIFGWWRRLPLSHVAIVGPRRSGKTSLLHYLHTITLTPPTQLRSDQKRDWLPNAQGYRWIWVDFQDPRMRQLDLLLQHLLAGFALPVPARCSLTDFVQQIEQRSQRQPTIILMDELGAGLTAPELDRSFWWGLRSLVSAAVDNQIAFCVAAHDAPERLAEDQDKTSPFFNMFNTLALGPLTEAEALALIATAPLRFSAEDIAWILAQSGRWPYLVQILCQERLLALEDNDASDLWKAEGLRRLEPYRSLLDAPKA